MKDLLVYKEIESHGIKLIIKVDYLKSEVSFVERSSYGEIPFKNKQWLFAGRTREYLGGWVNVFKAMEEATKIGDNLLKQREDANLKDKVELLNNVSQELRKGKK